MTTQSIWLRTPKIKGAQTPRTTFLFPKPYIAALRELARREKERNGIRPSHKTIIMTLTMEGANEYRPKQSELKAIYEQLNRENKHVNQGTTSTE